MIVNHYFWRFFGVIAIFVTASPTVLSSEFGGQWDDNRALLMEALKKHQIINPDRILTHISVTCHLNSAPSPAIQRDGAAKQPQISKKDKEQPKRYWVVDVRELVKGAMQARGYNQVVIVDDQLVPQATMEYFGRPLFCHQNQLYMNGPVKLKFQTKEQLDGFLFHQQGSPDTGNRITFNDQGQVIGIDNTDDNQWQGIK